MLFKQQVQFGKGSPCWFRNSKIGVDNAEEAQGGPEESGVQSPIPIALLMCQFDHPCTITLCTYRIQHIGGED